MKYATIALAVAMLVMPMTSAEAAEEETASESCREAIEEPGECIEFLEEKLPSLGCNSYSCTYASASAAHVPFGCAGGPDALCWNYDASGDHWLNELSLYAGGMGELAAQASNSGFGGVDRCDIEIGSSVCFTSVPGNGQWAGPATHPSPCVTAQGATHPNVGSSSFDTDAGTCKLS